MDNAQLERTLKSFIQDSLVSQSGNTLTPEVMSKLSNEILERIMSVLNDDYDY
jgi:hypothetical protein